jgi:metal-sulfur cluster biosynthetic enzyme
MIRIKNIDRTSNRDGMKFVVDQPITNGDTRTYSSKEESKGDELASLLFDVDHVRRVKYVNNEVAIKQDGEAPWSSLLKKLAPLIREATPVAHADSTEASAAAEEEREELSGAERQRIAQYLREVIDPELGVNIVDLGLIYDMRREADAIVIYFTATTPGCPMQHYLEQQIKRSLSKLDFDRQIRAELIWEPDWNIDMMSPDVKAYFAPA